MAKAVSERELVLGVLLEVTRDGVYSHIALRNVLTKYQYLDKKERAFITRVVEGTLEHMIEIDYIINQFSKVKVNKMKPVIRTIMRSAVYQLKYMDSVPSSAVCNEAVKLAEKKGFRTLKGFVNGVLRNIDRNLDQMKYPDESDTMEYLSIRYSMPKWILAHWMEQYDKETVVAMLEDFQTEKPTTIRCNLNQITPEELVQELRGEGVSVEQHPLLSYAFCISGYDYLGDLESFMRGDFYIQDLSSMYVAEMVDPKEGDYVIDVCAAPGGKALHVAEKLHGTGHVEARDLTEYKVGLIEENIERSNMENIEAVQQDATLEDETSIEKADIVIADLPCSGLGVLGKKTDLKYKMTEETEKEVAALQRQILSVVHRYVKPGGTFVYSTCTLHREENEGNAAWIEANCPGFKLLEQKTFLPGRDQTDGFFIAKFRKEPNGQ